MKRAALALVFILLVPSAIYAWGGDGHQIVCLIAEARLTPQATAAIHELLGNDVNISDAEIANWADQIRRQRRDTAPWHYVNIPSTQPSYDAPRDGEHGNNVIEKINEFEKVIADKGASKADRADALKFLVHFVGDVHQPLHCEIGTATKGGNSRLVFFAERQSAVNLHQVWDSLILLRRKGKTRVAEYTDELNAKITKEQGADWAEGCAEDWANESHRLAVECAYREVPADGDPPKLGKDYIDKNGRVIDEQLQKAGVRLAMVLNRAFAP